MLKAMRRHAKYFYFLFILVIITFIFWGVGTLDKPTAVSVAEINGEKISVEQYWRAYENARDNYRELYKEKFDEEMEKKLNLKETVLNALIEQKILLITAKELGLIVTDRELQDAIVNDPQFMREGIFRKDVYLRTLELNRLTPAIYEEAIREQLLVDKMRRLIGSAVDITLDIKNISSDEKAISELKKAVAPIKEQAAIKSYVDGIKQRMKLKVNMELIS